MADWSHLKESGHSCVGCGRGNVILTRLETYALAYSCWECFKRYWNCDTCGHHPHPLGRECKTCGCKEYRHQLAAEFDRQYANGVGVTARLKECQSYGVNLGKCGNVIFADASGTVGRLCRECERRWVQETTEAARSAGVLRSGTVSDAPPDEPEIGNRILH